MLTAANHLGSLHHTGLHHRHHRHHLGLHHAPVLASGWHHDNAIVTGGFHGYNAHSGDGLAPTLSAAGHSGDVNGVVGNAGILNDHSVSDEVAVAATNADHQTTTNAIVGGTGIAQGLHNGHGPADVGLLGSVAHGGFHSNFAFRHKIHKGHKKGLKRSKVGAT